MLFFPNWRCVAILSQASLSVPFFQKNLFISHLCVTFCKYICLFIIYICKFLQGIKASSFPSLTTTFAKYFPALDASVGLTAAGCGGAWGRSSQNMEHGDYPGTSWRRLWYMWELEPGSHSRIKATTVQPGSLTIWGESSCNVKCWLPPNYPLCLLCSPSLGYQYNHFRVMDKIQLLT